MMTEKRTILRQFTDDELKQELNRRRILERARRHLPSAEAALERAKEKVEKYRDALDEEQGTGKRKDGRRA